MKQNVLGISVIKQKVLNFLNKKGSSLYYLPQNKIDTLLCEDRLNKFFVNEINKDYIVVDIVINNVYVSNFFVKYEDIEFEFDLIGSIKFIEIINKFLEYKNFETKLI